MNDKYCPSNGSEGEGFMGQFCDQCAYDAKYRETQLGEDGCQIIIMTMIKNVDDPEYPSEWTYDDNGNPTCTKFLHEGEPIPYRCPNTQDMFGEG